MDITKNATADKTEYEYKKPVMPERVTETIRNEDIEKALEMIQEAKRPFIFVGGGSVISGASEAVNTFAHKVHAPGL